MTIDEMIANLEKDFDLKVEEDAFAFLGIEMIRDKKGNTISYVTVRPDG